MNIFVSHDGPHIFNNGHMRGYKPWEVSHLFSCEISHRMPSESCLRTPWGSSYDQSCKTCVFRKVRKRSQRSGRAIPLVAIPLVAIPLVAILLVAIPLVAIL